MDRIHTESGATYDVDWEAGRVRRRGPHSPGIDYEKIPDDEWHHFVGATPPTTGLGMQFFMGQTYRVTTPVTTVEVNVEANA